MAFISSNKYGSASRIASTLGIGNKMNSTIGSILSEKNICCVNGVGECCSELSAMKYVANTVGRTDILLKDLFSSSAYNDLWTRALDAFYNKQNELLNADKGAGVNTIWSPLETNVDEEYIPLNLTNSEKVDYLKYANTFSNRNELGNNINNLVSGKFVPLFEIKPENLMNLNTIDMKMRFYSLDKTQSFRGTAFNIILVRGEFDENGTNAIFAREATVSTLDLGTIILDGGNVYEYNRSVLIPAATYFAVSKTGNFDAETTKDVTNWSEFKTKVDSIISYNSTTRYFFALEVASPATDGRAFIEISASITNRESVDCGGCLKGNGQEGTYPKCTNCASVAEDNTYWTY